MGGPRHIPEGITASCAGRVPLRSCFSAPAARSLGLHFTPHQSAKGRSAYKSYLSSFTVDNAQKLFIGGFSGLDLLFNFHPQLEQSLKEHGGLKIHMSSIGLYRKSVQEGIDYNKWTDDELQSFWHTTHIVQITNNTTIKKTLKELGESLIEHVENREQSQRIYPVSYTHLTLPTIA